ncbi:hypothetical protein [Micromonospora auratinigra]|uniref:Uncharacterized protein n=1 Tax=Micromonospora auratinigra TaxID=261654 RepID=A0A1A8Z7V1_9ACTN|nr:hypothetical protein [Micromonospora auratinigra]SBT39863.1 hypothetical protein GA0070611_1053 [Micromonospora auratinigra]
MTASSATSLFAALLDRSVARIAELVADGRHVDRLAVAEIADVWDNSTLPFFRVALSRPGWVRERRARAALAWMADLGPARREWLVEQAAAAGHRLSPLLPPVVDHGPHHRDYRGVVHPGVVPLTGAGVDSVARDYDLARAEVRELRVERAGRLLRGGVAVAAPRRYTGSGGHADAVVRLDLTDLREVRCDSADRSGLTLTLDQGGVEVRLGARGSLRAAAAVVGFDDASWHESQAGRAAVADTPVERRVRRPRPIERPALGDGTADAAMVLRELMLVIRSVRYPKLVGRIPVRTLCDAVAGAGDAVLTAAGRPWPVRDRAFRRLAEGWLGAAGPAAHLLVRWLPPGHWARAAVPAGPPPAAPVGLPDRAQLTLAAYAWSGPDGDTSAVVNLAVPEGDGGWGLRAVQFPGPVRLALRTAAFTAPGALSRADDGSLRLGAEDLAVTVG